MQQGSGDVGIRVLEWFASAIGGALTGALVTVVGFRTRLAILEQRIETVDAMRSEEHRRLEVDFEKREQVIDEQLSKIERRQLITLRVLADIARKQGIDARIFDDAVVRFINAENDK